MFNFFLCDVGYWISVKIRVNTVQKVKRKNMLPRYVGSFAAEVRTVFSAIVFKFLLILEAF